MSSAREKSLSILINGLKDGGIEATARSDDFILGDVSWVADVRISRHSYVNPDSRQPRNRIYAWYNYRMSLACMLPDDVKFYNCNSEVEHVRFWAKKGKTTDGQEFYVPDMRPGMCSTMVDRLQHRFTHEDRIMRYSAIVDPGPSEENHLDLAGRILKIDIKLKLVDPIVPVRTNDLPSCDSPWNDLEILCQDNRVIRTSKALLASCSEYFHSLLYGSFKEKFMDRVHLPSLNADEFEEFLQHLHPYCRRPITAKNVEILLLVADTFLFNVVTEECEKFLLFSNRCDSISWSEKSNMADTFRLARLKQQCEFNLTVEVDKCVLTNDKISLESHNPVHD